MFGFQPMGFGGGFAPQGFGGMYGPPPMMNMQFAPQRPQGFGGGFQGGYGGGFAPPPQFQPGFGGGMPTDNDRARSAPPQAAQSAGPSDAEFLRNISGLSPSVQQQMLAERQRDQLPPGQRQFGPSTGPDVSNTFIDMPYVDSGKPDQYRPSRRSGESPFGGGFAQLPQFQPNVGGGMPQGGGFGGFAPQGMSPYGGGPQFQPPAFGGFGMPAFGMPAFGMPPQQGRSFGMPGMEASPPFGGGMGPMPQFGGGQRQLMFGGGGFGGPQGMPQFGGGFQAPQFAMPQFGGLLGFGGGMPSNMGPQMPQTKPQVKAAAQQMQDMPPVMGDMRYRGGPMTPEQEAFGAQREQDMLRMMQMTGLNPGVTQPNYQRRDRNGA